MTRMPCAFLGWNQERTGRTMSLVAASQTLRSRKSWWRRCETELQRRTRRAIVRPTTVEGPIENESTFASVLMSMPTQFDLSLSLLNRDPPNSPRAGHNDLRGAERGIGGRSSSADVSRGVFPLLPIKPEFACLPPSRFSTHAKEQSLRRDPPNVHTRSTGKKEKANQENDVHRFQEGMIKRADGETSIPPKAKPGSPLRFPNAKSERFPVGQPLPKAMDMLREEFRRGGGRWRGRRKEENGDDAEPIRRNRWIDARTWRARRAGPTWPRSG